MVDKTSNKKLEAEMLEFVKDGIVALREGQVDKNNQPRKGVLLSASGLKALFIEQFKVSPYEYVKETKTATGFIAEAIKAGLIDGRPEQGGPVIYLPGEMPKSAMSPAKLDDARARLNAFMAKKATAHTA